MSWKKRATPIELTDNEIHVWQVDLDQLDIDIQYLNKEEQQRANKMPIKKYQLRFVNARGMLRHLLSQYLSIPPQEIMLTPSSKGKLYLPKIYNLYFNLAHSKNMAVYAFNYHDEIGIDIEAERNLNDLRAIAERVFSTIELNYLFNEKTKENKQTKFFKLWSRKEATIKATGEGLTAPLTNINTTLENGSINENIAYLNQQQLQLQDLPNLKDYAGAIVGNINKELIYTSHCSA